MVLDCGYSLMEVKKALNFDLSKIACCYISHAHTDHSKYIKEFTNAGIPVFAPYQHNKIKENVKYGNYTLQAFQVPHGECINYGLIVSHVNGERLLYLTDLEYCRYTFGNMKINHYLVECNYQDKYLDINAPNYEHKRSGHCSLETCKEIIKSNLNCHMKNVLLIHMGLNSVNADECVSEISEIAGDSVNVMYATNRTEYDLKI